MIKDERLLNFTTDPDDAFLMLLHVAGNIRVATALLGCPESLVSLLPRRTPSPLSTSTSPSLQSLTFFYNPHIPPILLPFSLSDP